MIENIRAVTEWVRGSVSDAYSSDTGRYVGAVALAVLLVGLSGYMAAAGGVTVDFSLGESEDGPASAGTNDAALQASEGESDTQAASAPLEDEQRRDSDGDGLTDVAEREIYGTNESNADTDGDGIPDGMEVHCSAAYPDADPLRQDVYVELDSVDGVELSEQSVAELRTAFADAPVDNPGESGIAVHFVRSDGELPEEGSVNDEARPGAYNDVEDYRESHFQHEAAGYHYLLVSTEVAYKGDEYYAGAGEPGTAIVESYDGDGVMSSLVLHELGHSFGLDRSSEGVDARDYTPEEYASVMNYNALYEMTTYSDGEDDVGRNEWRYVGEDRHRPETETGDDGCPAIP